MEGAGGGIDVKGNTGRGKVNCKRQFIRGKESGGVWEGVTDE